MRALTATVLLLVSMAVSAAPAPERVTMPIEDVQKVLTYLATRPYSEVYTIVPLLLRAQPVVEAKPKEVAKKSKSRKSKESKK